MSFNAHPIQWHEGMFMMPHHFQENDALYHNLLHYNLSHIAPYHWGVSDFIYDEASLAQGIFRVLSLRCVMPDGTVLTFPSSPDDSLELRLNNILEEERRPYKIYLSLAKRQGQEGANANLSARYKAIEETSQDINAPDSSISMTRLKPLLSLSVVQENVAQRVFLPLAIVERQGPKITCPKYLPPSLVLEAHDELRARCASISKTVRDKILYLQKKVQERSRTTTSLFDAQSIWQFDTIRRHLIVGLVNFETLVQEKQLHPYSLYRELLHLSSRCAAVKWGGAAPTFPTYDHTNIRFCFEELLNFIEEALREIEEAYRVYVFKKKGRIFSLQLEHEWTNQPLIIGLRSPPNETEGNMVRWIKNAVIVSQSHISVVQENRILGATRRYIETARKIRLIPDRGTVLCEVIPDKIFITPGEQLHIFNISDDESKRPEEIVFYAPQKEDH